MAVTPIDPRLKEAMRVDKMLYIRANGHATFTVSVPPEQVQEVSEALAIITMNEGDARGKSRGAITAIIKEAKHILKQRPDIGEYLAPQLKVFGQEMN